MSRAGLFQPYTPCVRTVVRLEEVLPADHPVHVWVDLVPSIELSHFVIPPRPMGEKPYHRHALLGILAWGYLHRVRSQEAASVYLARGGRPDFRPLARLRRDNAGAFTPIFQETGAPALHLGLALLAKRPARTRSTGVGPRRSPTSSWTGEERRSRSGWRPPRSATPRASRCCSRPSSR